jgi:NADH:ubiquinone oxidoreductase subunit 6 (subunit J)
MPEILIDIFLYLSYALIIGGVASAIIFAVTQLAKNPSKAKNTLIGLAILVVLFGLGFALSSGELNAKFVELKTSSETVKTVGAGLVSLYILAVAALVIVVLTEIKGLFK